jgi:uncharacterized membrane protein YGL010W
LQQKTSNMHPLLLTIVRRPDLVIDHLSAYAALLKQETNEASKALVGRVLVWLIAVMSLAICVVLSGTALMLGVLQNQFHWILVAVPGAMALCALGAFAWTTQNVVASHFNNITSQLLSDASALHVAAGHEAK